MKAKLAKLALSVLLLLTISACGIFEVGIEKPATPQATTQLTPTAPPTSTVPPPTPTPFPGQLKPGQPVRITRINMLNKTFGWAIGQVETDLNDHILFTTDSGRTWQDRTPPDAFLKPSANGLAATAYFGPDGGAWVAYASSIPQDPMRARQVLWHTQDSGQTWQFSGLELSGFQAEFFIPAEIGFLDAQNGWLLAHTGAGMSHDYIVAFTTSDGGQNWQRVLDAENNPELMACQKTGLVFSTTTHGWLTGNCPGLLDYLFFYSTTDGGQTWQPASLYPPANQPADLFTSNKAFCGIPEVLYVTARSTLLTVRCEYTATNRINAWLYTIQAGGVQEARPLPMPFGAIQFINADEGWMVGTQVYDPAAPGEIFHTLDGGRNWTPVIATAWQGTPNFIDANTGWVVARSADTQAFVYTTNGGLLWEEISPLIGK